MEWPAHLPIVRGGGVTLGILVRPVFTNILLLACLLFVKWFYNLKPFACFSIMV